MVLFLLIVHHGAYLNPNLDNMSHPAAYSAKPTGDFLQIFNALTGAPYFSIHIGQRGLTTYFMSGSTLTVTFKTGVSEIWDLNNRRLLR